MDIKTFVHNTALEAKEGARSLAKASSSRKNAALAAMADALKKNAGKLLQANKKDIWFAEKKGLSKALIDRLALNEKRIHEMAQGLVEVAALPDPVGEITRMWQRPSHGYPTRPGMSNSCANTLRQPLTTSLSFICRPVSRAN